MRIALVRRVRRIRLQIVLKEIIRHSVTLQVISGRLGYPHKRVTPGEHIWVYRLGLTNKFMKRTDYEEDEVSRKRVNGYQNSWGIIINSSFAILSLRHQLHYIMTSNHGRDLICPYSGSRGSQALRQSRIPGHCETRRHSQNSLPGIFFTM